MAYQSEIELRVKVVDRELKALEQQINKIESRAKAVNPFSASGASKENKKALDLQQRLMAAEKARLSVDKNRLQLNIDLNQQRIKSINLNTSWYKALQTGKEIQLDINKAVAREAQLRKQATAKKRNRLKEDLALGVGFPLLFGGGAGSVIGGAAGALAGGGAGGFGLQILGSAIGQQVDAFIQATTEAGVALTSTGGALEFVREKALFSSAENEELAAKLEEQGDAAGLSALLTQELADKIGNQGVQALGDLGTETENVTTLWNELTLQLQALIAGPLSDFLSLIGDLLGEQVAFNRLSRLQQDLAGTEEGKRLDAAVASLKTPGTVELGDGRTIEDPFAFTNQFTGKAATDLFEQFKEFRPTPEKLIPITAQDRRDITPGKTKAGRRSRVPDLNAEIQLQERLLTLNNQIAQAKRDENPVREAALQMEVALEKEAAKIAQIEAKRIPEVEKVLEKQLLQVQTSQELANIQNRLNDAKAQEAEKAQDVLDSLLNEQALLQATLDGRKEEEQISQRVAEIKKQNPTLAEAEVKAILEGNQALREKITLQQEQEQLYARIGQTISSGIVGGIQSAIDGSKSLGESLSGILKQLGGIFLQSAIGGFGTGGKPGTGLFGLLGFADGGYVTGPTPAVVGEGGEPEYVIPQSKMRESMARYSRGARGSAVIPENGGDGASGEGGGTAVAAPIDVRYTVERINSVDYVTADQFQRGMQQAAASGAKQGEQRALTTLRQNTSQRRRIGL